MVLFPRLLPREGGAFFNVDFFRKRREKNPPAGKARSFEVGVMIDGKRGRVRIF